MHSWRFAHLLLPGQCKFVVRQKLLKHAGSKIVLRRRLLFLINFAISCLSIYNVDMDEFGFSRFWCASQDVALCIAASLRCGLIGKLRGLWSGINPMPSRVAWRIGVSHRRRIKCVLQWGRSAIFAFLISAWVEIQSLIDQLFLWLLVLLLMLLMFKAVSTETDVVLAIIGKRCWFPWFVCSFLLFDSYSMVATQWCIQDIFLQSVAAVTNLL